MDNIFKDLWSDGNFWIKFVPPIVHWDGTFRKKVSRNRKVSICTTCMNRLKDIKRTLPKNIKDNSDYPNVEFILLDYNSSDGLGDWVRSEMLEHIKNDTLVYFRTEEPQFYSMTHSRNIAFKVATGEIVNNVDSDNYTNKGFATYINRLAEEVPKRAIFGKGRRMLRGRLGFYRQEFIDLLGGYNEQLIGYGHDDHDLLHRAWGLKFKLAWFGGQFYSIVEDHKKHEQGNYPHTDWKYTERLNKIVSYFNISIKRFKANEGEKWGSTKLIRNFSEEIET